MQSTPLTRPMPAMTPAQGALSLPSRSGSPPPSVAFSTCALRSSTTTRMAAALAWKSAERALSFVSSAGMGFFLSGRFLFRQPELVLHGIAYLELLDLAGHGHGEGVDEADVARNLVVGDLALAEGAQLLF